MNNDNTPRNPYDEASRFMGLQPLEGDPELCIIATPVRAVVAMMLASSVELLSPILENDKPSKLLLDLVAIAQELEVEKRAEWWWDVRRLSYEQICAVFSARARER